MVLLEVEEKLKKIMTREISLFALYKDEFSSMRKLVLEKEWISLQRSFEAIQNVSNEIEIALQALFTETEWR